MVGKTGEDYFRGPNVFQSPPPKLLRHSPIWYNNIFDSNNIRQLFKLTPLTEVWGVGDHGFPDPYDATNGAVV